MSGGCVQDGVNGHDHCHANEAHPDALRMEQEEQEERAALERILRAFRAYEVQAGWEVDRWEHNHQRLQPRHQALVSEQPAKFARARQCIAANQAVIREMLAAFEGPGAPPHPVSLPGPGEQQGGTDYKDVSGVSSADIDKVKYVFKNLVRDWSEEGAWERSASYGHILSELLSHFPRAGAAAPAAAAAAAASGVGLLQSGGGPAARSATTTAPGTARRASSSPAAAGLGEPASWRSAPPGVAPPGTPAGGGPSYGTTAGIAAATPHGGTGTRILLPGGPALLLRGPLRRPPAPAAPHLATTVRRQHTPHAPPLHAGSVVRAAQDVVRQRGLRGAHRIPVAAAAHVAA
mmetsp:Transcript_8009/g.23682  ORF Transcript_8009/g.23682 Transcript_8009/m.23682 type:complete len:348 (-) Transcript_8009:3546-4589(-)